MKNNVIHLLVLIAVILAILGGNVVLTMSVPANGDEINIGLAPTETTVEEPKETETASVTVPESSGTDVVTEQDPVMTDEEPVITEPVVTTAPVVPETTESEPDTTETEPAPPAAETFAPDDTKQVTTVPETVIPAEPETVETNTEESKEETEA